MDCSVIICTRNRARILPHTIQSILNQKYDRDQLEIFIVDNGSEDNTRNIVKSFASTAHYTIKYVYESKLGLSNARNCGIKNANGDVVIFIDDDAIPRRDNWIQQIVNVYSDPNICCAGGDIELNWQQEKRPEWLHDLLLIPLGLTRFNSNEINELKYPIFPWGGNISFRKESLERLNGFSTEFGRIGNRLLCNEETELCLRLVKSGAKIVYVPNALVDHFVLPGRLTKEWFKKSAIGQGLSDATIDILHVSRARVFVTIIWKLIVLTALPLALVFSSLFRAKKWYMLFYYKLRVSCFYLLRIVRLKYHE